MATIKPFKGTRPAKDKVHLVTSRSFDTYDMHTLQDKLKYNPYSFLHIIKPEFGSDKKTKPTTQEHLHKIKARFEDFVKKEYFVVDKEKSLYVYQQESHGNTYTGIIGCASIDDYFNGNIKVHEQTLGLREEKLKEYLKVVEINAEPICLTYPPDDGIDDLVNSIINTEPVYDFTTTDTSRHKLWQIADDITKNAIVDKFEKIESLYIADGHHRSASSALLGKTIRKENPAYESSAGFNYFLSIFIPFNQLKIYEYNRMVKDLNGLSSQEFLARIKEKFQIEKLGKKAVRPEQNRAFGMYLDGSWYLLKASSSLYSKKENPSDALDAKILSQHILSPVLNITDLSSRKSNRISFVGGVEKDSLAVLKKNVDEGEMKVAFSLFPATVEQLKDVADAGDVMPPKSTWIEPKLRSGLVIYSFSC